MAKVIVYHERYGCDTGCCGHAVYVDDERQGFEFGGTGDMDPREYAEFLVIQELGREHVADLDWENCLVLDCSISC